MSWTASSLDVVGRLRQPVGLSAVEAGIWIVDQRILHAVPYRPKSSAWLRSIALQVSLCVSRIHAKLDARPLAGHLSRRGRVAGSQGSVWWLSLGVWSTPPPPRPGRLLARLDARVDAQGSCPLLVIVAHGTSRTQGRTSSLPGVMRGESVVE